MHLQTHIMQMHVMHKKHVQLGIKEGRVFSEGPEN